MHIDDLLRIAMERKASDLHLKVGNYPHIRVDGELVPLSDHARVSAEDMLNMAFSMMSNRQKQKFKESAELDMAYGVAGLGRFRVNVFQQRGNVGLVLRMIPTKIRSLDELYLPSIIEKICDEARGLVRVGGEDAIRVPGGMGSDVFHGLLQPGDHLEPQHQGEPLGVEILRAGGR